MRDVLHARRYTSFVRLSVFSLALLGFVYAAFSLLLFRDGIPARAVWLPISPGRYYIAQAIFVGPLFVILAIVFVLVVHAIVGHSRGDANGTSQPHSRRAVFEALAPRYALPIVFLFLLPDILVFLTMGHAKLAPMMRYYGLLAPIAIVTSTVMWLRRQTSVGMARAIFAAIVGLVSQAVVGAPLLR
jgi:hypothetical protein